MHDPDEDLHTLLAESLATKSTIELTPDEIKIALAWRIQLIHSELANCVPTVLDEQESDDAEDCEPVHAVRKPAGRRKEVSDVWIVYYYLKLLRSGLLKAEAVEKISSAYGCNSNHAAIQRIKRAVTARKKIRSKRGESVEDLVGIIPPSWPKV